MYSPSEAVSDIEIFLYNTNCSGVVCSVITCHLSQDLCSQVRGAGDPKCQPSPLPFLHYSNVEIDGSLSHIVQAHFTEHVVPEAIDDHGQQRIQ